LEPRVANILQKTPVNEEIQLLQRRISLKRLDQIHPLVNGNKYYKLKYNIEKVLGSPGQKLLTFGGAFSNHIHATAAAGKAFGIPTIGIIRGDELEHSKTLSPTLEFAKSQGMQLEFVTRDAYAEKDTEDFKGWLYEQFGDIHIVPEGGSNFLGVNGCMEILSDEDKPTFDLITCAVGTGSTLAGILLSMKPNQYVLGFSSLRHGDWLRDEVLKHLRYFLMDDDAAGELSSQFTIITRYDFGGYAKWNDELMQFIRQFETDHGIPLDQVYTGKMMYGLLDMIANGELDDYHNILAIHTGGLQGKTVG
jgi:1-aminocyclopropane-1-carboxylate deaminase